MALDFLSADPDRVIRVSYDHDMKACELLELTSKEMGRTPEQYLERMRDPKVRGGRDLDLPLITGDGGNSRFV
jgi:hypothetical protein